MAKEFGERPYSPFDRVLNSIEHVARHRSAKFLRSSDKPKGFLLFLKVTNLDFFLVSALMLTVIVVVGYTVLRFFFGLFCSASKKAVKEHGNKESKKTR